jgi:hypothetical protein
MSALRLPNVNCAIKRRIMWPAAAARECQLGFDLGKRFSPFSGGAAGKWHFNATRAHTPQMAKHTKECEKQSDFIKRL